MKLKSIVTLAAAAALAVQSVFAANLPEFQSSEQLRALRAEQTAANQSSTAADQCVGLSAPTFYTGKINETNEGKHLFMFRSYDADLSRWTTLDASGFPDGPNGFAYITNDPLRWLDASGLSGTLVIHSSSDGTSSSSTSGHSWISYTPDGGNTTTYGSWGNNPTGQGNGLFTNLEQSFASQVSRSSYLDNSQEQSLMNTIGNYQSMGSSAWSYTNPCSGFASNAWRHATGEALNDGWPVSTPTTLKSSIFSKNGNQNSGLLE